MLSFVTQVTQVEFPVSLDPEASGRLEGRGKGEEDLPLVWLENATNVPVFYGQVNTGILRLSLHKAKMGICGSSERVVVTSKLCRPVRACGLQVSCSEQDELRPMTVRCFGWDRPVGEGDVDRDPYQVSKPNAHMQQQNTCNGSVSMAFGSC